MQNLLQTERLQFVKPFLLTLSCLPTPLSRPALVCYQAIDVYLSVQTAQKSGSGKSYLEAAISCMGFVHSFLYARSVYLFMHVKNLIQTLHPDSYENQNTPTKVLGTILKIHNSIFYILAMLQKQNSAMQAVHLCIDSMNAVFLSVEAAYESKTSLTALHALHASGQFFRLCHMGTKPSSPVRAFTTCCYANNTWKLPLDCLPEELQFQVGNGIYSENLWQHLMTTQKFNGIDPKEAFAGLSQIVLEFTYQQGRHPDIYRIIVNLPKTS